MVEAVDALDDEVVDVVVVVVVSSATRAQLAILKATAPTSTNPIKINSRNQDFRIKFTVSYARKSLPNPHPTRSPQKKPYCSKHQEPTSFH